MFESLWATLGFEQSITRHPFIVFTDCFQIEPEDRVVATYIHVMSPASETAVYCAVTLKY